MRRSAFKFDNNRKHLRFFLTVKRREKKFKKINILPLSIFDILFGGTPVRCPIVSQRVKNDRTISHFKLKTKQFYTDLYSNIDIEIDIEMNICVKIKGIEL